MHTDGTRPSAGQIVSARYRIIYTGLYIAFMGVGLAAFFDHVGTTLSAWSWVEPISYLCVAAAGAAFVAAEITEGAIVIGQALLRIIERWRQRRDEALIERGRREERERLRREGFPIDGSPGGQGHFRVGPAP